MPRVVWLAVLLCLGCAGARPTTEPAPSAAIDAMLLPPVGGQVALWVNQPANFAVIGVATERGADVLYQQTALEGVPRSGYVYVPRGDAGYDRIYLVASHDPIDLTGSLEDATAGASVVDAYAADTLGLDSLRCNDGRLALVRWRIVEEHPKRTREEEERFADCYLEHYFERHRYHIAAGRQFFAITPKRPTHKYLPPGYKPPKLVPKPGTRLERSDERALRWYASKDQWHAITHNGEPGTELPRVLGYVRYSTGWAPKSESVMLATANDQVRAIMNGTVGSVHGAQGSAHVEYVTTSGSYHAGSASYSSSGHSSGSVAHASYSAPSSGAPSHVASSSSSAGSSSSGSHH